MQDTTAEPDTLRPHDLARLSVVIPVHDEETWIGTSIDAVADSARAAGIALDLVVVDDGSTDGTAMILADLAARGQIRVHTQANAGRMAARRAGVMLAREDTVLLLDSRVVTTPGALSWLRTQMADHPQREVWSGHVEVAPDGRPYAPFWSGLVKIGWRAYTSQPRLVSFGPDEFDRYPKGTGCLVVPREVLLRAMDGFESLYDESHLSSDDTRLLRYVAEERRFWLAPEFAFTYHGKSGMRGFAKQSYFRGTTFVDGYIERPGVVRTALFGAIGVGVVAIGAAIWRPVLAVAGVAVLSGGTAGVVRAVGGSPAEVRAAAALAPVFTPAFGAGVLRGLVLAARSRLRARSGGNHDTSVPPTPPAT